MQLPGQPAKRPSTYAGVGSRNTPPAVIELMNLIGKSFASRKFKLRTGDAAGADTAFTQGALSKLSPEEAVQLIEAYVPYSKVPTKPYERRPDLSVLPALRKIFLETHPKPDALQGYGRELMERNALQVLGPKLNDPIDFLVGALKPKHLQRGTWDVGGTGQAYRLANREGIPIFDVSPTTGEGNLRAALKQYEKRGGAEGEALDKMVEFIMKKRGTRNLTVSGPVKKSITLVNSGPYTLNLMRANNGNSHMNNTEPGKPGFLGNPYKWEGNGGPRGVTVQEVVEKFKKDFLEKVKDPAFRAALEKGRGGNAHYYKPDEAGPTHAKVIRDWLAEN